MPLTVGVLREMLQNLPDTMEIVIEDPVGNQGDCAASCCGVAKVLSYRHERCGSYVPLQFIGENNDYSPADFEADAEHAFMLSFH